MAFELHLVKQNHTEGVSFPSERAAGVRRRGVMGLRGVQELIMRITALMTENRRRADHDNREFLEFWQMHYGR